MEDFKGFRFGNIHSSDLRLTVVSSGDRFNKNVLPSQNNYTTDIPGGDGTYYFGQTFGNREFTINVAFEDIDEMTWRRISQIFSNDKLQDLVFDENPYKTYRAKLSQKPDFKFVCFRDKLSGERVYKGEGTLNFICYHPLAYCFNKYIIKASDNYKWHYPWDLKRDKTDKRSFFNPLSKEKKITGKILEHYKPDDHNMDEDWEGGYQRYKQVQNGDLNGLDARRYYDNVPKWAAASKLLYSPTLDYDQELIYCPQYSRIQYYNMDTGLNEKNSVLGSRLLVYNPGDVPIDFELKLGNLTANFRGNIDNAIFRISRYNVQRLSIQQAVDWADLKIDYPLLNTKDEKGNTIDDTTYKYGTKYFTQVYEPDVGDINPQYSLKGLNHPNHCYLVEPIPQEKLGYFIRLFYWQSNLLFNKNLENGKYDDNNQEFYPDGIKQDINRHILDHNEGEQMASEYEHLRELCIDDDERNSLYWTYLKELLKKYSNFVNNENYTINNFINDFIYHPLDYIRCNADSEYGEFNFNLSRMPQYMTFDYFDISNHNFNNIPYADCGCTSEENHHREQILPLILDSEKRMIYNWNEPQWENTAEFKENNSKKLKNFYNFKPTKTIWNDNIVRGHWFQLPPGWSMIEIAPVIDEDVWGGKRWLDARPFNWGDSLENGHSSQRATKRTQYENILLAVTKDYLSKHYGGKEELPSDFQDETDITELEPYIQFRRWYGGTDSESDLNYNITYSDLKTKSQQGKMKSLFLAELHQYRCNNAELNFLKQIALWYKMKYKKDVNDWWWWANHYIWANFPPIYWGYADLLSKAEIKYIPQYY